MSLITTNTGILNVNTYILVNDKTKEAIIIDAGGSIEKLKKISKDRGITYKYLLLTHGHFDHIGAGKVLQDMGVKVYIHKNDDKMLYTDENRGFLAGITCEKFHSDYNFKDGEILNLCGFEIKVILTAGHTSGSCVFLVEDMMFSGDTLFYRSYGRTDIGGDMQDLQNSLKKLFELEKDYKVYTGHEGFTTLNEEKKFNPILEGLDDDNN